jgi:hypothetical protein
MSENETSGKAIASFVLGLLGLTTGYLCPLFPVFAIVLGMNEREGLGRAGVILGWIGIVLYAMAAVVGLLFVVLGGLAMNA